jgi:Icc-related predicted phosphoesterase
MSNQDRMRIAALADLHYGRADRKELVEVLTQASRASDVVLLCGDMTDHGRPDEARMLAQDIEDHVSSRVLAVLGNHDLASDTEDELVDALRRGGIRVLDGDAEAIGSVGFAGVRGFCGGFGNRAVHPFGERELRAFINATVDEALKLETALTRLDTTHRVVLMHYSPIRETVEGEPAEIIPFLGSSRLEDPLNHHQATVVFHGHAHKGAPTGRTGVGIPVFNVSLPVLQRAYPDRPPFRLYEV